MLKDIAKIKLKGANFLEEQLLPIFVQEGGAVTKATLVYGRNGAGKSTIAKAFKRIKGEIESTIKVVSSLDSNGSVVNLSEEDIDHIFIFDEDYVTKNVHIQEEGLGSIVMLGEQSVLQEQITEATEALHLAERERDHEKSIVDEYSDSLNEMSPFFLS